MLSRPSLSDALRVARKASRSVRLSCALGRQRGALTSAEALERRDRDSYRVASKKVSSDIWRSLEFYAPPTPPPPGGASRSMWRCGGGPAHAVACRRQRRALGLARPRVRLAEPGDRGGNFPPLSLGLFVAL